MKHETAGSVKTGDLLPPLTLVKPDGGESLIIPEPSRDALVFLLLPSPVASWTGYLAELNGAADDIRYWYARIVIASPADVAGTLQKMASRLTVLAEAGTPLYLRLGVSPASATLLIVDRYGQVYHVTEARGADELPEVDEIEEWVKFLATQCPECGVIDEPGYGEWSLN